MTALNIDCRTEFLTSDGLCIVQNDHTEQKKKTTQMPLNKPKLKKESTTQQTNQNDDDISSIDDFKAFLDSITKMAK